MSLDSITVSLSVGSLGSIFVAGKDGDAGAFDVVVGLRSAEYFCPRHQIGELFGSSFLGSGSQKYRTNRL